MNTQTSKRKKRVMLAAARLSSSSLGQAHTNLLREFHSDIARKTRSARRESSQDDYEDEDDNTLIPFPLIQHSTPKINTVEHQYKLQTISLLLAKNHLHTSAVRVHVKQFSWQSFR